MAEKKLRNVRNSELADEDDEDDEEPFKGSSSSNSYTLSKNQTSHGSQLFNRGARREGRENAEDITMDEEEGGGRYGDKGTDVKRRGAPQGKKGTTLIAEELYHRIGLRPNALATSAVNAIDTWMLLTGRWPYEFLYIFGIFIFRCFIGFCDTTLCFDLPSFYISRCFTFGSSSSL